MARESKITPQVISRALELLSTFTSKETNKRLQNEFAMSERTAATAISNAKREQEQMAAAMDSGYLFDVPAQEETRAAVNLEPDQEPREIYSADSLPDFADIKKHLLAQALNTTETASYEKDRIAASKVALDIMKDLEAKAGDDSELSAAEADALLLNEMANIFGFDKSAFFMRTAERQLEAAQDRLEAASDE